MDLDERINALCGRLSRSAWVYLQQLRNHLKFDQLLAEIEQLDGKLIETDIKQVFMRFSIQHPGGLQIH
jgi:hypothetical protein